MGKGVTYKNSILVGSDYIVEKELFDNLNFSSVKIISTCVYNKYADDTNDLYSDIYSFYATCLGVIDCNLDILKELNSFDKCASSESVKLFFERAKCAENLKDIVSCDSDLSNIILYSPSYEAFDCLDFSDFNNRNNYFSFMSSYCKGYNVGSSIDINRLFDLYYSLNDNISLYIKDDNNKKIRVKY